MAFTFDADGALLVIDMLNDFIHEKGALVVPGASRIVSRISDLVRDARQQGIPVIYVADRHRPDDREFQHWPPHAIAGTWGGEVVEELAPGEKDYLIPKRRYSAFFGTDLDTYLREMGVGKLYLTGVLTNICVYATALDAAMRNYRVAVFRDGVASLSEETDAFIFKQLEEVLQAELI
ncbi:cysteine hydrolase family protein [Candidatus Solincola sp.]|nr:isochorismatase family cysteine hydrolase [Actinomycetota bacterium]